MDLDLWISKVKEGNHLSEDELQLLCEYVYGFYDECQRKYGNANAWRYCTDVFDYLTLSAIIDGTVLCVHGGLSPDVRTVDQIRVIERNCEIPHEGPFCDLMWSDPEEIETWAVSPRGAGWLFGSRVTSEFNHINSLDLVCRAHQLVQEGLKYMFQDKGLVTEREVKFFTETEENNQMRGPRTDGDGTGVAGVGQEAEAEEEELIVMGSYGGRVRAVEDAPEEILLLWSFQQPTLSKPNAFVRHSSSLLRIDSCGRHLSIIQSPSSMVGVVLGKFLEHSVDPGTLVLHGKKVIELGSGCGLVGCISALLGADVILTDLPDRLKLLKQNVECNVIEGNMRGSAAVRELTWGDDLNCEFIEPLPDFVLGSDVIYSEAAVADLLATLKGLSGSNTTIFLTGESRNDVVLECFLEAALEDFLVGHVDQAQWCPEYRSHRVAMFVLVKRDNGKQLIPEV
ncbi:Phytochrome-associated serine/threonine-protein phosphatase 1 [Acorus calamus]|uniref:protein-serine/threonine phosphatase n=1 Tax=Acorus calamus TaxID=4465 RepID=A0AAV9FI63_ACOCL|nr:Phytochrome-associated serine/threonine-protein phosphatase 1 [Acorus calamus]